RRRLWTGKGKKSAQKKQSEPSSINGSFDRFHSPSKKCHCVLRFFYSRGCVISNPNALRKLHLPEGRHSRMPFPPQGFGRISLRLKRESRRISDWPPD